MSLNNKYGLIGKQLGHSFSKKYFEEKFAAESINASYANFELEEVGELQAVLQTDGLKGLNVTIPYKEQVGQFLDEIDPEAKDIGAINTIKIKDGKSIGYNTDVYGFKQMIKPFLTSKHERALLLGTGGASRAVEYVLTDLGLSVLFVSRKPSPFAFKYHEVNEHMINSCGLIVNCTPVGMFPNVDEQPEIPIDKVGKEHLVIDLIYNPEETLFLKSAREAGANTLNGSTMLQQQAEKSWEIWNAK